MRYALLLAFVLLLGCGSSDDYADRMADEHAGETPTATAATAGADTLGVTGEPVVYATVGSEAVTGYLARPATRAAAPRPGIIVIQEWWGLNDNIRAMADRLAAEGYTALAVDLYGGHVATSSDSAYAYMQSAMSNEAALEDNLVQAHRYLVTEQGAPTVGSIGWCFGGGWSLRTALLLPDSLDAAVMYYGQPITERERLAPLNTPLLGLFGAEDQGIPVDNVRAMRAMLDELNKPATVIVYDGADHAFANPSGGRYDAEAAEDAWDRTLAFFSEHLGG